VGVVCIESGETRVGGIGKEEEIKTFFQEYMQKKALARDVIKLSLERLAVNARIRASS
jgi:hypothetical protein